VLEGTLNLVDWGEQAALRDDALGKKGVNDLTIYETQVAERELSCRKKNVFTANETSLPKKQKSSSIFPSI